jgi:pyridoxal phosphate enzyme (YggS family)
MNVPTETGGDVARQADGRHDPDASGGPSDDPSRAATDGASALAVTDGAEGSTAADGAPALAARRAAVLARIDAAARAAGRDPASVDLLAVGKTFDAATVLALAAAGQRAYGENYLQEALPKMAAVRDEWSAGGARRPALDWHFIGPIQSNKTRAIAESFDWVHSVDREKVAARLSEQRPDALGPLQVCVQVDVSGEATKSGCDPDEALALARRIAEMPRLRLRGVMAIPAPTDDPAAQREQFARVRSVYERMRADGLPVDTMSMGMSGDLESAIAEGATIVRVGTALFGSRPVKGGGA